MKQSAETDAAQLRTEIRNALVERLEWFNARYDTVSVFAFGPSSKRVYLGDKAKQICRYCGREVSLVEFKKLTHAIPDQVGNDWLFDYEECDTCNGHFARWVEDDFAKWTHPWQTLGRIKGKKGVPSIKSNDQKLRIDATVASTTAETGAGEVAVGLSSVAGSKRQPSAVVHGMLLHRLLWPTGAGQHSRQLKTKSKLRRTTQKQSRNQDSRKK